MALALKKYGSGKLTWAELIEPARRLAADGFVVTRRTERLLHDDQELLGPFADSRRIFLRDGNLFREGEVLRQPDLAATLERLQKKGAREFYEGETARLITNDMRQHRGLITADDLREYTPKERAPLHGSYRGHEMISMPPPSAGGAILIDMLNILEGFNEEAPAVFIRLLPPPSRSDAPRLCGPGGIFGDADFASVHVLLDGESGHGAVAVRGRGAVAAVRVSSAGGRLVSAGQCHVYRLSLAAHPGAVALAELSRVGLGEMELRWLAAGSERNRRGCGADRAGRILANRA
jgi:hypothetical protein